MTGWKCPGCGRCWAPQIVQCAPCEKAALAKAAPPHPFIPQWPMQLLSQPKREPREPFPEMSNE
jgi:hypothetical protein